MKWKFFVVMVFVVGFKVVILDEFIVGVDLYVWWGIWDLFFYYKIGIVCVIVWIFFYFKVKFLNFRWYR